MNGPTLICIACQWRTDDKVHQKYCDKRTGDPDGKNRHFLVPVDSVEGREMVILRDEREKREQRSLMLDPVWSPRLGQALCHYDMMKTRMMLGQRELLERDEEVYDQVDITLRAHEIVRRVVVYGRVEAAQVKLVLSMHGCVQLRLVTVRGIGDVSVYGRRPRWKEGVEVSGHNEALLPFRQDFELEPVQAVVEYLAARLGSPKVDVEEPGP